MDAPLVDKSIDIDVIVNCTLPVPSIQDAFADIGTVRTWDSIMADADPINNPARCATPTAYDGHEVLYINLWDCLTLVNLIVLTQHEFLCWKCATQDMTRLVAQFPVLRADKPLRVAVFKALREAAASTFPYLVIE
jgi:hypothetical protein